MKMLNGFANKLNTNYFQKVNGIPLADSGYAGVPTVTNFTDKVPGAWLFVESAWVFQKTDGTSRLFAVDKFNGDIQELTTTSTWTDRSGAAYAVDNWTMCQFGDQTIACSIGNTTQVATTGNFGALAGSPPKAKFCCTQGLTVFLAHYNDGTLYQDGWWASDTGDATTWTPSASNDAAYGRLLQTPGPITGMVSFRNKVYLFKESSFYVAEYVGYPVIWQVSVVDYSIGASQNGAILNCGDCIIFGNRSGFYKFDGQSVQKIATVDVQSTYYSIYNGYRYESSYYDEIFGIAYFGGGVGSNLLFYNKLSDSWGFGTGDSTYTYRFVRGNTSAYSSDLPGSNGPLYHPSFFYEDTTPTSGQRIGQLVIGSSGSVTVSSTTFGGPLAMTTWRKATPVFIGVNGTTPTLGTMSIWTGKAPIYNSYPLSLDTVLAGSATATAAPTYSSNITPRYDFLVTGRYMQYQVTISNITALYDIVVDGIPAGAE